METKGMAEVQVTIPAEKISEFCRRWKVSELALFGSALREGFGPDSDVDVLITFASTARWSLFDLVVMEDELQAILDREVDLVERAAVEKADNYTRRRSILDNIEVIYAAG
jgi:predicted nucleotidyltransferase